MQQARSETVKANGISLQARHHNELRRQVLAQHPEARTLVGASTSTALVLPALFALHWGAAYLASGTSLLGTFVLAFCAGQLLLHTGGALLHESAHRLIFRRPVPRLLFDAGLELLLGSYGRQLTFQHQHVLSHHRHLGDYAHDYEHEDICAYRARRCHATLHPVRARLLTLALLLAHLLPLGFVFAGDLALWYYGRATGLPVRDVARELPSSRPSAAQRWLFIALSVANNLALYTLFGGYGLLYHLWSLSLFLGKCGITNVGQTLSEHADDDPSSPTQSVYDPTNVFLLNTGYHNEHHTFPDVAWHRLPRLKALAPELFQARCPYSYLRLWWDHVCSDFAPMRRNVFVSQVERELARPLPVSALRRPAHQSLDA